MKKILLVEDDEALSELLALTLEIEGFAITPVHHGEEAILCLEKESFDLLVVDLMMPVMDGVRFLSWLRQHPHFTLPVVVLSSIVRTDMEARVQPYHPDAILKKPVDVSQFVTTIQRLLG